MELGSPALQADSSPAEAPGKSRNNADWYRVGNSIQWQYFQSIGWVLGPHRTRWCQYQLLTVSRSALVPIRFERQVPGDARIARSSWRSVCNRLAQKPARDGGKSRIILTTTEAWGKEARLLSVFISSSKSRECSDLLIWVVPLRILHQLPWNPKLTHRQHRLIHSHAKNVFRTSYMSSGELYSETRTLNKTASYLRSVAVVQWWFCPQRTLDHTLGQFGSLWVGFTHGV